MPYLCANFFISQFQSLDISLRGNVLTVKNVLFSNFAKHVQARPQCNSHCSPACWMLLTSVFHPMTVGTLPAPWSFSLSWEIIFSQVMTLPCFLLIFYTISPRAQSLCFTPCFVLLLSSVYRLITLLSPHHISQSPSPSSPLSVLCVCVCLTRVQCLGMLPLTAGWGCRRRWERGRVGMRGGWERQRDRPPSPWRFPPALSEEVSVAALWCRLHHAEVWSCENAFWPRFALPHWQELGQTLSSAQSLAHFSIPLLKTVWENIVSSPVRKIKTLKFYVFNSVMFTSSLNIKLGKNFLLEHNNTRLGFILF